MAMLRNTVWYMSVIAIKDSEGIYYSTTIKTNLQKRVQR